MHSKFESVDASAQKQQRPNGSVPAPVMKIMEAPSRGCRLPLTASKPVEYTGSFAESAALTLQAKAQHHQHILLPRIDASGLSSHTGRTGVCLV